MPQRPATANPSISSKDNPALFKANFAHSFCILKTEESADSSVLSIQKECAKLALNNAGLSFEDIDGLAVAGLWGMPGPGVMQPNVLTEYLGISYPKWLDGTNTGGHQCLCHLTI